MATITLKGNEVHTAGEFPRVASKAPDFTLTDRDLNDVSLSRWMGKKKLLSICPASTPGLRGVDAQVQRLRAQARGHRHADDLGDLPFAHKRFCGDEGLENVVTLSTMRSDGLRARPTAC
jgi:thioredoxin-dependent peroxiredoxin